MVNKAFAHLVKLQLLLDHVKSIPTLQCFQARRWCTKQHKLSVEAFLTWSYKSRYFYQNGKCYINDSKCIW